MVSSEANPIFCSRGRRWSGHEGEIDSQFVSIPQHQWTWDGDLRWPQWVKLAARGIIGTIKTFRIDQTKSFLELYAFKVAMEIAKNMNFHENQGFPLKFSKSWKFMSFVISMTTSNAFLKLVKTLCLINTKCFYGPNNASRGQFDRLGPP